jgi:hypothetical protein
MTLYHGSNVTVEKPSVTFCRERTDFGRGFYVTPLKEQAVRWAARFSETKGTGFVSEYGFLEKSSEALPDSLRVLEFDTHNMEWLNFVTACRLGQPVDAGWDVIIGGVANDKVILTLQLYFNEIIRAEDAIRRLRYNKPNFQYCFKNQAIIDNYLTFIRAEALA